MSSKHVYDAFIKVHTAANRDEKWLALKRCNDLELLRKVLQYAYHPHWHYGFKLSMRDKIASGDEALDFNVFDVLARSEPTQEIRKLVRQRLNSLAYEDAVLFVGVINKNLGIGMGATTINKIFPGLIPVFGVQLASPFAIKRARFPLLVSYKLDGLRAIYKEGKFYSRLGNQFKGLEALEAQVADIIGARSGMELDGELMVEGEHFNEISGQLRSFNATDNAVFNVFDTPSLSAAPLTARLEAITKLPFSGNVQQVQHTLAYDKYDLDDLYSEAIEAGYEGLMVKDPSAQYERRRSYSWQKIKPAHTIDARVLGTFEGRGKYEGMCGGLIIAHGVTRVRVGSGLSDMQRQLWAEDSGEIVGKTIEVAYQEVTPDGSLRHPRLKVVRGDK